MRLPYEVFSSYLIRLSIFLIGFQIEFCISQGPLYVIGSLHSDGGIVKDCAIKPQTHTAKDEEVVKLGQASSNKLS